MRVFKEKVMTADALVTALSLKSRFFSSLYKMFCDRSFFNGHRPILEGKQIGYIISGPLKDNHNVKEFLEAFTEIGRCNLAGLITDE